MIARSTSPTRAPRAAALLSLASLALVVTACNKPDANAATTKPETMMVGPENVTIVRAQQIRTGPALSGSLTPLALKW